jgi:hypothetical protein
MRHNQSFGIALLALLALAGCGGGSKKAAPPTTETSAATTTAALPKTTTGSNAPGALLPETASAAQGDIPDNQVFVTFTGPAFSMKTPEGWTQAVSGKNVTFRDKNNIVRVVVGQGPAPTVASVKQELALLKGAHLESPPASLKIGGLPAVKAVYSTKSAPNPVTGRSVKLIVDRYELGRSGKRATVDLGTPIGVDNVDAYRLMIESFRLR